MKWTVWKVISVAIAITLVILLFVGQTTLDVTLLGLLVCLQNTFKEDKSK